LHGPATPRQRTEQEREDAFSSGASDAGHADNIATPHFKRGMSDGAATDVSRDEQGIVVLRREFIGCGLKLIEFVANEQSNQA
jgi:hypothetical protein